MAAATRALAACPDICEQPVASCSYDRSIFMEYCITAGLNITQEPLPPLNRQVLANTILQQPPPAKLRRPCSHLAV